MDKLETIVAASIITLISAFSLEAYSQAPLASISNSPTIVSSNINMEKKEKKSIRPEGEPYLTLDLRGHRKLVFDFSIGAGVVEIRENSMYINLLSNSYQILFEQVNDSTFTEQLYTMNMETGKERHEKFTTIRKKDNSLIFAKYDTIAGTSRKEKLPLIGSVYAPKFMPVITIVKQFFSNSLPDEINVVVMGTKYTARLYTYKVTNNKKGEREALRYAKMTELVTRTKDDIIIMDDKVSLYTVERPEIVNGKRAIVTYPEKIEAKFAVVNSGWFWNGEDYRAVATVREK